MFLSLSVCSGTGVRASTISWWSDAQFRPPITSWSIWWTDGNRCSAIATDVVSVSCIQRNPKSGHPSLLFNNRHIEHLHRIDKIWRNMTSYLRHYRRRTVRIDCCAAPWPLAISYLHSGYRQRNSVGILLDIVEPDVARATRFSSPAGHWLSALVGIHHQMQSIMCWCWWAQACNMAKHR